MPLAEPAELAEESHTTAARMRRASRGIPTGTCRRPRKLAGILTVPVGIPRPALPSSRCWPRVSNSDTLPPREHLVPAVEQQAFVAPAGRWQRPPTSEYSGRGDAGGPIKEPSELASR